MAEPTPTEPHEGPVAIEATPPERGPRPDEVAKACKRGACFDAKCLERVKRRFPDICIWPAGESNPDFGGGLNPCTYDFEACPAKPPHAPKR